jgi:hypothetical protein
MNNGDGDDIIYKYIENIATMGESRILEEALPLLAQ